MMHWIHYILIAFEAWGIIYFFDSFMDARRQDKKWLRCLLVYAEIIAAIFVTQIIPGYGDIAKSIIIVVALIITCIVLYNTSIIAGIFFSALNYILLFFTDCVFVTLFGMQETPFNHVLWVGIKVLWIVLLLILRRKLPHIRRYLNENRISWTSFAWLPVFSGVIGIYFYILFLSDAEPEWFYSFISLGIICLNVISLP